MALEKLQVLVVDDDWTTRAVLEGYLRPLGIQITEATNGETALDLALRGNFGLIISDVQMPGIDGLELCRRLKNDPRTRRIPVIIVSVLDNDEEIEKGFEAGAAAYLPKPIVKREFYQILDEILDKSFRHREQRILVVDDSHVARLLAEQTLSVEGFEVRTATNGREGLTIAREWRPHLILSDYYMPEMDGDAFCEALRQDKELASIPFVLMSGFSDRSTMRRLLRKGVSAFFTKPFSPEQLLAIVERLLDDQVLLLLKEKERVETEARMTFGIVLSLAQALDARDGYTNSHSVNVAHIASLLAQELGCDEETISIVRLAGRLHDIGKIGICDAVLQKRGPLDEEEYAAIQAHPVIGTNILRPVPTFEPILPAVLHHHERYDGKGYPQGLAGEAIPLVARILAVANAWHWLTCPSAFRECVSPDEAIRRIRAEVNRHFCPRCVEAFLHLYERGALTMKGPLLDGYPTL